MSDFQGMIKQLYRMVADWCFRNSNSYEYEKIFLDSGNEYEKIFLDSSDTETWQACNIKDKFNSIPQEILTRDPTWTDFKEALVNVSYANLENQYTDMILPNIPDMEVAFETIQRNLSNKAKMRTFQQNVQDISSSVYKDENGLEALRKAQLRVPVGGIAIKQPATAS